MTQASPQNLPPQNLLPQNQTAARIEADVEELIAAPPERSLSPDATEPQQTDAETPDSIAPGTASRQDSFRAQWFLGLDIGTTGISAVLLNRSSGQLHPIYWYQPPDAAGLDRAAAEPRSDAAIEKQFRLPLAVSLASGQEQTGEALLRDFKPYLNWTLPYNLALPAEQTAAAQSSSEPILSWSNQPMPLITLRQSLQALLSPIAVEPTEDSLLRCGAVDLEAVSPICQQLEGVIVSLPAGWSDAYRFNLREALLAAQLADRPEQILFLEESIATLLAAFAASAQSPLQMPQGQVQHEIEWQGNTLILCAGATQTDLALVDLPQGDGATAPEQTIYSGFHFRSLAYAGSAIDQDIVSQLLYPLLPTTAQTDLASIDFPAVGEPDSLQREVFQQRLRGTATGRSLLQTARALKLNLQQQNRYVVQVGEQQTSLLRQDLTTKVLLPYVQRLNRELNALLSQTETPALNVRQVVCTGGTASLGAITRWLQQKLPNALILQDAYPWVRSLDCIPTCSRVAYGLAALPFYPHACDRATHQYGDFFLLQALLRDFPNRAVTLDEVLELLQARGIDAAVCRSRILAILEGHLPAGLIPSESQIGLLSPLSQQNPDYQAIAAAPLFHPEQYPDGKAYRLDRAQLIPLRHYWEQVLQSGQQTLTEANRSLEFGIRFA